MGKKRVTQKKIKYCHVNIIRVNKVKEIPNGHKARLVKGFSQQKRVDYNEPFNTVARMTTIRVVLTVAASYHRKLNQYDMSTAFLYGKLDKNEEIYIQQPQGFEYGSNKVYKLKKSLD